MYVPVPIFVILSTAVMIGLVAVFLGLMAFGEDLVKFVNVRRIFRNI